MQVDATTEPNRIRRRKRPQVRVVVPERVVVQPRFPVQVLPLHPQVLLELNCLVR